MNTSKKFMKILTFSRYLKDFSLVDTSLLLDFILDVKSKSYRIKTEPLDFLYSYTIEKICSMNRVQLEVLFERIRTTCHANADLLKHILPRIDNELLNKLSFPM